MAAADLLRFDEVVAGYGKETILHGLTFTVSRGAITTVIGPNGAGKSTAFKAAFGMLPVRSGRVFFDEREITNRAPRDLIAEGICYVPQGRNIFPELSVLHNLEFGGVAAPKGFDLKPRMEASAVGIKKITDADQVQRIFDELGDAQSRYLIEQFVRGEVYHVDSIVSNGKLVLCEKHRYHQPPFEVYHGGGLFRTSTLERGSAEDVELERLTQLLATSFGIDLGILHTEYIRGADDGEFYFLETAARVGGAYISEMVEVSTGVNLWREWAALEIAAARGVAYELPPVRKDYGGVILSLARQQWPDTSFYNDLEIVHRIGKEYHAGFVLRSDSHDRIAELLREYGERFTHDFAAKMPAKESLR